MVGKLHSLESFGTVDGPGIRLVVFLKGCPMRCAYCHNTDTWTMEGAKEITVDRIMEEYEKKKPFYKEGGITVTGGEPLMQLDFVTELFTEAHKRKIHTCLDTSGAPFKPDDPEYLEKIDKLLEVTDLVMLDIKHIDPKKHKELTKRPNDNILKFAEYLNEKDVTIWIRHVVVPGITDDEESLLDLGRFIGKLKNVKALDALPYHDMGKTKYEQLGIEYPLEDVEPATKEQAMEARETILKGFKESRLELKKQAQEAKKAQAEEETKETEEAKEADEAQESEEQ